MRNILLFSLMVCVLSVPAFATDLTFFGGFQHSGSVSIQSFESSTGSFISNFNPRSFGVFGIKLDHGKIIGGSHTLSYSPSFIYSGTKALNYSSDLIVQAPLPIVKPYVSAGLGVIYSGTGLASFGTKFAVNYGGGVKVKISGPLSGRLDVRGYMLPGVTYQNFSIQGQSLNFFEVTTGIVLGF